MGITIEISSLEEMCDLMCNNAIPKQKRNGITLRSEPTRSTQGTI